MTFSAAPAKSIPARLAIPYPISPFFLDLLNNSLYDLLSYVRSCGFYPFGLFKPLMDGYMKRKSKIPFLKRRRDFVFSET
jgi:alpha-N-acetylglucosamine transferase